MNASVPQGYFLSARTPVANVPLTVVVRKGGPGATVVLKVNTLPNPFREVLLEGAFQVHFGD